MSRLSTPNVLSLRSRCLGLMNGDGSDSPMEFSSARKQVICGGWPRAAAIRLESLSEKLGGRDDAAKASSPDRGRMVRRWRDKKDGQEMLCLEMPHRKWEGFGQKTLISHR